MDSITPGPLVTPPCQWRVLKGVRCGHFPTSKCGRLWYCRYHTREYLIRQAVARARRKFQRWAKRSQL